MIKHALSLSLLFAVGASVGCSTNVPPDIKPTLDSIRVDARAVADAAATACAEQYKIGRFFADSDGCGTRALPGETLKPALPSPAKGTSLESNPLVADVQVTCTTPWLSDTKGARAHATLCSPGLDSLRTPSIPSLNEVHADIKSTHHLEKKIDPATAESNCKESPTNCESVNVPSEYVADADTADLHIFKPFGTAGGTAEVVVILAKK